MMNGFVDIPGYEGLFQINRGATVISLPSAKKRVGRKSGNTIVPQLDTRSGYYAVTLRREGTVKRWYVHRLIARTFIPNPSNKPCINHINSNRVDNRIENLEWVTFSENNSHAHKFGGQKEYKREKHSQAKLSEIQVAEIRSRYIKRVHTMDMLADEYGMSKGAINAIVTNKTWQHGK